LHAFKSKNEKLCLFSVSKEGEARLLELNGGEERLLEGPKKKIICCDLSKRNIVMASTDIGSLLIWHMNENRWQELNINVKAHLIHICKFADQGNNGEIVILLRDRNKFYYFEITFSHPQYNSEGSSPKIVAQAENEIFSDQNITCLTSAAQNPNNFYFAYGNQVYCMDIFVKRMPKSIFEVTSSIQQLLIVDCKQYHYMLIFDQGIEIREKESVAYSTLTTLLLNDNIKPTIVVTPTRVNVQWDGGKAQLQFVKKDSTHFSLIMMTKEFISMDENGKAKVEYWLQNMPIEFLH
jgi:hypothetical protein